jgi:hypothetical protein
MIIQLRKEVCGPYVRAVVRQPIWSREEACVPSNLAPSLTSALKSCPTRPLITCGTISARPSEERGIEKAGADSARDLAVWGA